MSVFDYCISLPPVDKKREAVLNNSFNKCEVNSPKNTKFLSSRLAIDFYKSGYPKELLSFFIFHEEWLKINNFWENMQEFFRHLIDSWNDPEIPEREKMVFIWNVFILRTFEGIRIESAFEDCVRFGGFEIKHSSENQDINLGIDFETSLYYFQLKPASFFAGRKKEYIQRSIKKMLTHRYPKPLFISLYENGVFSVLVISFNGSWSFKRVPIKDFLMNYQFQGIPDLISRITLEKL